MGTIYRGVNESQLDLNDLLTLLDSKSTVIEKEDATDYEFKGGAVEYKNVSYGHRDKLTIKDVSFSVEPGSKVAVIGESGIGKSTIFKLLYRLFDPETGNILLDG
jgi:ABC-type multidrug transport system fused ATPase/permease subunit